MNPLISINLCCYNSEKYLRETLQSIVGQTYGNWELVIINDGSTDATESIIHEFRSQGYPIIYHYQQNKGLSKSRNKAVELSTGNHIAFIDHDDVWLPEKLERQIQIINEETGDLGIVYSKASWFNEIGEEGELPWKYISLPCPEGHVLEDLLMEGLFIPLSTAVVLKDAYVSVGGVPDLFVQSEDYYLFVAIASSYKVRCVQKVCCRYRMHGSNSTPRQMKKGYEEILEIYAKWFPLMNKQVSEKQKEIKMKEINTLIGGAMIKYDGQYYQGLKKILTKGSIRFLLKRIFIDRLS
jgi:glycosyltransferase involved in cell wall biosynthesis